ncbi:MAG: hypothetical protein H6862_07050 [Rhodospirillales bacterium]|nr:hypothetical protein [Rhodospirillales bacterium]
MHTPAYDPEARTAGTMPVWGGGQNARSPVKTAEFTPESLAPAAGNPPDSEDGFGFYDFLDIVNPLQHLPIVSYIYREITDDQIKPVARIAGGGLFGGLAGAAVSTVNVALEEETGKDITGNILALVSDDGPDSRTQGTPLTPVVSQPLAPPNAPEDIASLPGSTIAMAEMRKPAMKSFVLNT